MKLATVFQISIYSLTALAATMLTVAEERLFPVAVTVPLSFAALVCNERLHILRISTFWGNLLGLAAVVLNAIEFFGQEMEGRLLAGAHLLVYLTWITLFQQKASRQYWWLLALGLLQVAFGSILTISGWYGALLCAYLLLAVWTLSVFSLYRGELEFTGIERLSELARPPAGARSKTPAPAPTLKVPVREAAILAAAQPVVPAAGLVPPVRVQVTATRPFVQSVVQNSIQHDPRERWINARFVAGITSMSLAGLCLGLAFFLLVPRLWIGSPNVFANPVVAGGRALTGFTEEVRLGDLGTILESNARVMQIRLVDNDTIRPVDIKEFAERYGCSEPLFRGTVLDTYSNGRWSGESHANGFRFLRTYPGRGNLVRQEITLEPIGTDILFAMQPTNAGLLTTFHETIQINNFNSMLVWSRRGNEAIVYTIYSHAYPRDTLPGERIRFRDRLMPDGFRSLLQRAVYLKLPPRGLERLTALVRELTDQKRLAVNSKVPESLRTALALESHLKDSGLYSYSLNATIQDSSIDAVEDFLFNRKSGHCEYYASALALMLRAAGIPARLVSGFKGGNQNPIGGYFEVQQRHAHSWVEAHIGDGWIVLDPTPAAREASVNSMASGPGLIRNTQSFLAAYWSNYIVSLSFSRQQESFFDPLQQSLTESWASMKDARQGAGNVMAWLRVLYDSPEKWFSWQGGLTGAALVLLIGGIVALFQTVGRLIRGIRRRIREGEQAQQMRVDFYERFLRIVAANGLSHEPVQTQREFAEQVRQSLSDQLGPAGLAHAPADLAALFYRVRFGGEPLASDERVEVRRQLDEFEMCLKMGGFPPVKKSDHGA